MKKTYIGITSNIDGDNVFSLRRAYCKMVANCGAIPIILPSVCDPVDALCLCDGVILSGGGDIAPERFGVYDYDRTLISGLKPERDNFELILAKKAYEQGVPTLGICRGIQVMNVALGGTLLIDIPDHRQIDNKDVFHKVTVEPGTSLSKMLSIKIQSNLRVNSAHHQALDKIAPPLRVSAFCDDGVIEAVEARDCRFYIGVQWHPERMTGDSAAMIITALADAARK